MSAFDIEVESYIDNVTSVSQMLVPKYRLGLFAKEMEILFAWPSKHHYWFKLPKKSISSKQVFLISEYKNYE